MARLTNAKCRNCRRIGEKLFLKGERCFTAKCAAVKKAYAPGNQGKNTRRKGLSEFGRQLAQKQKIKRTYGIMERQLKNYFVAAQAQKGDARENLLRKLEIRLDNVVFRLGWANSRSAARQMVSHGHIQVNGHRLDIPSYEVKKGDIIAIGAKARKSKMTENLAQILKKHQTPTWLALDVEKLEAKVLAAPEGEELGEIAPISLIVESYSR